LGAFLLYGYFGYARRDANGGIDGSGILRVSDLSVGDCFSVMEDEFSEVSASPCSEPHQYELFHRARWTGGETYPSDDAARDFVIAECGPAFIDYVGGLDSAPSLDLQVFGPTRESWKDGLRVFQCAVYDLADASLTQSLRSP
jgi:hypothetical protein